MKCYGNGEKLHTVCMLSSYHVAHTMKTADEIHVLRMSTDWVEPNNYNTENIDRNEPGINKQAVLMLSLTQLTLKLSSFWGITCSVVSLGYIPK